MKFDMTEALGGRLLAQTDVSEDGVNLKIKGVTKEVVGDDNTKKFALHFEGGNYLPMLMNKTNVRILIGLFGKDASEWKGQPICVYHDPNVMYAGKQVGGLRVKKARKVSEDAMKAISEMVDDIEF